MTDPHSKDKPKQETAFTNILGSSFAAIGKLFVFQPLDTVTANAMLGKERVSGFMAQLWACSPIQRAKMLYKGSFIELFKKWPSNVYRYSAQHMGEQYLKAEHAEKLSELFGQHAEAAAAASAAAGTAFMEPFLFHPLDTIQLHQQIHQSSALKVYRQLKWGELYKGTLATAALRNAPSGMTLFGGAAMLNQAMGNADKSDNATNLAAKTSAGVASIVVSQPGEIVKVHMQNHQWSFRESMRRITVRELMTNALSWRLLGGIKIGAGVFMAEKGMKVAADLFGEEGEDHQPSRSFRK